MHRKRKLATRSCPTTSFLPEDAIHRNGCNHGNFNGVRVHSTCKKYFARFRFVVSTESRRTACSRIFSADSNALACIFSQASGDQRLLERTRPGGKVVAGGVCTKEWRSRGSAQLFFRDPNERRTTATATSANKRLGRKRSDMRCRIRQRARLCGFTKSFTVGLTTTALPKTRCRGIKCSTTFHSTGSQTPRHRQHGSTGRIRAAHFQEASSLCLWPQPSSRERYIVLQGAGPSRPIRISFTGTRLSTAAISPRSNSRTFLSRKCAPRFEN